MTTAVMKRYEEFLKAKEAELVEALKHREGIAIQHTADTLDEVLLPVEREMAVRNLDRKGRLLHAIRLALAWQLQDKVPAGCCTGLFHSSWP